ncbi:MAG: polysulfide reductase [Deltaproteobacteria bacterium RIFCSPHIGHO2_12_FULL_43_9]|nr:MAG: polysulfide reductase [Deltaproteobacteria bacterium RIFCSPHIGHO2_12_FULL_43_9]
MFESIGFLFPNDLHVHWTLMIVMYPYITGLVAGAFIVSSMYHVFGKEEFKPIGRYSLLVSLAFLVVATLPLLLHLGHPERSFNIVITPNFSSAMAGFGFLYAFYLLILLLEVWLVFRPDIIECARASTGFRRAMYKFLALGVYDISPQTLKRDRRVVTILAAVGIPAACTLHGYVGFLFGAIKANPWWSTPLMPVIFLFSAVVSGIAALIIFYQISMKVRGEQIDQRCISGLSRILWYFLIVTVTLELLEIITLGYERAEEWEVISQILTHQLSFSFISVQMIGGALIPMILLGIAVLMDKHLLPPLRNTLAFVAGSLLMMQVLAMRWNVVIGGQIFSKSLRGFRDYSAEFLGKEGILVAIIIFAIPCLLVYVFNRILPSFQTKELD